jgi:hypothetical protein
MGSLHGTLPAFLDLGAAGDADVTTAWGMGVEWGISILDSGAAVNDGGRHSTPPHCGKGYRLVNYSVVCSDLNNNSPFIFSRA